MENQINSLRKEIEILLKDFFSVKQKEAEKLSPIYFDLVNQIAKMTLSGGKRIRPILVYYGYKSICEPKTKISDQQILSFSLCTELFQTACLIHDDIMDNAKTRRGELTIQKYFENYFSRHSGERQRLQNRFWTSQNDVETARNFAILAGDLALVWADELFHVTDINVDVIKSVLPLFNKLRSEVIFGQTLDLMLPYLSLRAKRSNPKTEEIASPRVNAMCAMTEEEYILQMYEYKTARYSFARPLQLGAKLAGASDNELKILNDYAIPVGIAFQIQDDILGIFGEATGKDVDSDIKEGKETLLIHISKVKAQSFHLRQDFGGQAKIKKKLEKILGNKNSSEEDINWVRNLIKESGALKYCQDKAEKLIKEAKKTLNNSPFSPETKNFLLWLADFCIARKA